MSNLEDQVAGEKPGYLLRAVDFIPFYGIFSHAKRSGIYAKDHPDSMLQSLGRGAVVVVYNSAILTAYPLAKLADLV